MVRGPYVVVVVLSQRSWHVPFWEPPSPGGPGLGLSPTCWALHACQVSSKHPGDWLPFRPLKRPATSVTDGRVAQHTKANGESHPWRRGWNTHLGKGPQWVARQKTQNNMKNILLHIINTCAGTMKNNVFFIYLLSLHVVFFKNCTHT